MTDTTRRPTEHLEKLADSILADLISIDTTSHKTNEPLVSYVAARAEDADVAFEIAPSTREGKASIMLTSGKATSPRRALLLTGHTDVVPVTGQKWTSDPFALSRRDERLFGRGTADMKSFIACALAVVLTTTQSAISRPVRLLLTHDEEVGCLGAHELISSRPSWFRDVYGCVVGEPTDMEIVVGHKGKQIYRFTATGEAMHASLAATASNPISDLAIFARHIDTQNRVFSRLGPFDDRFPIPYSWLNMGVVSGGASVNIVPSEVTLDFEVRNIPMQSAEEIERCLQQRVQSLVTLSEAPSDSASSFALERLTNTPPLETDLEHPFVAAAVRSAAPANAPGFVSFGTEAGIYQNATGAPTLVCGPGSINQAHKPNEYVAKSQLRSCLLFLSTLVQTA